jgi:hypothetical protein
MRRTFVALLTTAALATPAAVRGADAELTQLTGPVLPMPAPVPIAPGHVTIVRPNRMDIWQYYGVDRSGRWRPRVALTGDGAFYLYNGMPYPLLPVQQTKVMPYLFD